MKTGETKTVLVTMDAHYSSMGEAAVVKTDDGHNYMWGLPMPDDWKPGSRYFVTIQKIDSPNETAFDNPYTKRGRGQS